MASFRQSHDRAFALKPFFKMMIIEERQKVRRVSLATVHASLHTASLLPRRCANSDVATYISAGT